MQTLKITLLIAAMASAGLMTTAEAKGGPRGGERASFEDLDANADGEVSLAEIQAHGAARFAEADADGDGALSAEEMLAQADARREGRIERMIERLDENGDGLLQQAELEAARQGRRGPDPAAMFERLDADESGGISQEEFETAREARGGGRHGGPRGERGGDSDDG